MLIRAIALCVALLVGVGIMIPMMTDSSEAGPKYSKYKKKRTWNVKKYSKKWWALYRKQQRRKQATVARRRALRARQILLARQTDEQTGMRNQPAENASFEKVSASRQRSVVREEAAILPSGETAPQTWKRASVTSGELQYRVNDENGNPMGAASLTVVGTATETDSGGGRNNKTLGGVSTGALRRTVIDKMMKEEGFVVNDYQKDLNGKKVYVVVAQSSVGGTVQSKLFYFTEADGRIYSLATSAPLNSQERLAQESERVINSLQRTNRPVQAGLK